MFIIDKTNYNVNKQQIHIALLYTLTYNTLYQIKDSGVTMNKYVVMGGNKLDGQLEVFSAKNCVLVLLAASILTEEQVIIHKCPRITDVYNMLLILNELGVKTTWQGDSIVIDSSNANNYEMPQSISKEIRSSIFLMGSILGRFKQAKAAFPGGCDIGIRPIDLHLKGLRKLNVKIVEQGGFLLCTGKDMRGATIHLDIPSVGATENIILTAVLANGITRIINAAKEPEIVSLVDMLKKMGAIVSGEGTSEIEIVGVSKLYGTEFTPIPDRIVAGTYLLAAAATKGNIHIINCIPQHIEALISKANGLCCDIIKHKDSITVRGYDKPKSIELIETLPFPGFATDLQAQAMSVQTVSDGVSIIIENMFETRFKHVSELTKMGAKITVRENLAVVRGVKRLTGADVNVYDLRGGAAIVIAALNAEGVTVINDISHIERGYCNFDLALRSVGAQIDKIR